MYLLGAYLSTLFSGFLVGVYVYYFIDTPLFVGTPSTGDVVGVGAVIAFILLASIIITVKCNRLLKDKTDDKK